IFFLYSSQGRLIGTVRASRQERDGRPVGVVDAPGVIAEARGDGLYRPLLLHAIAWLAAQGIVDIRIESWGDSPAVLADYQALGFSVARRETLFRRALTSPR
ncbi:MAG TPA: GNAT family N-acetyltransferase, partial [Ktedonobacterales bacterium]